MPQTSYGYKDGAGTWYITVDTDACDGCGDCVEVCPSGLWELREDEFAILEEGDPVAAIREERRKSLRYDCAPCKSPSGDGAGTAACAEACHADAIALSW